jgi:uncharacterized protein (DUF433 family)
MLEQEKVTRFYTGFIPQEINSAIDFSMASITHTNFPHLEKAEFTGGPRAVIRGTRIPVSIIIDYLLLGETPKTIVEEILPKLTLAQVLDAIKYYSVFKAQIDEERRENTEEAGRKFLREKLGEDGYRAITGG